MSRAAWFKGIQLWEEAEPWNPHASRMGEGRHTGALRTWGKAVAGSPNFLREVEVPTVIGPMDAASDLDEETSMLCLLAQLEDALVAAAASKGFLAWSKDVTQKATLTGGPYAAPGTVGHGAAGGGWVPAAGELVLLRDPTTEAGFVARITATPSGTSATLEEVETGTWQTCTAGWVMHYVQLAAGDAEYERMSPGATPSVATSKAFRRGVSYLFTVTGAWHYATKHVITRSA